MLISFEARPAKSRSVCDDCSRSFECRNLKSALCIMEQEIYGSALAKEVADVEAFKAALADFGYSYPQADSLCELGTNKELMRVMVERALSLLKRFRFAKKNQVA